MTLRTLLPLAVALAVAGCNKSNNLQVNRSLDGGERKPMVWRVGNGSEPEDLDPQAITGVPEHKLMMALFEGLVAEDPKDLSPVPGVAESWQISPDGKVYTFRLRADAKWSDGQPTTADDFVQAYKRMLSPKFAAEYANLIYDYVVNAKEYYDGKLTDFSQVGVKAVDPRTLQVTLKSPTPYLLKIIASHYAWTPVPVRVIAKHGAIDQKSTAWTKPGNFVGNGPFILKRWEPNKILTVERNPHYWDRATVKLDGIEFYPIDDISAEERMYRSGQLDMTNELPVAKIDTYRKEDPASLRIDPYLGIYYYMLNVEKPPLNDKRVRKALALAIDRESLVKNVTRGEQKPAYSVSPPNNAGYTPVARLTGGVAEAKQLLAEAGFPNGRGFPRVEILYNTSENHRVIAEAIQEMWRQNLGVDVQLTNQEWKVYLDMKDTGNYQIARAGWIADYVDPHVFLEIWKTGQGNNDTRWSNAEFDRLLDQTFVAKNDQERYAIYQKLDAIIADEVPIIPIYYYTRVHAVSPRVQGYHPTLLDSHPYKHIWLEDAPAKK